MYSFKTLIDLKDELFGIGYCDELVSILFNKIYQTNMEECDGCNLTEFIKEQINSDLNHYGVCFIQLANATGEDKTFVHTFALFRTDKNELIRMESYGRQLVFETIDNKIYCRAGGPLYHTRLVEHPTFFDDINKLIPPSEYRLAYWNGLFNGNEILDTDEPIDIVLFRPSYQ